ncbi:hypothetical protein BKA70DRAFT_1233235 [Coprinopsis sp. MPI-PUGE-AT-0042]|nr:hypothetical protein BKA70DRAFT_1233235 [Coprinopsis sp. MPI-PUGE-AT-0042]
MDAIGCDLRSLLQRVVPHHRAKARGLTTQPLWMPESFSYPPMSAFMEVEFDSLLEYSAARLSLCASTYLQRHPKLSQCERGIWETSLKREIRLFIRIDSEIQVKRGIPLWCLQPVENGDMWTPSVAVSLAVYGARQLVPGHTARNSFRLHPTLFPFTPQRNIL